MVRLIKGLASEPDPETARRLREKITETFQGVGVALLNLSAAVHKAGQDMRLTMDPLYRASRARDWEAQFPLYPCPYVLDYGAHEGCGQVWDRRRVTAPELRGLVWEHIQTVHVGGERGQRIADQYVRQIMDRP